MSVHLTSNNPGMAMENSGFSAKKRCVVIFHQLACGDKKPAGRQLCFVGSVPEL